MDFRTSVSKNLKAYAQFSGRASRSEYWWFCAFYMLCILGASIIDAAAIGILQLQTPYFIFSLIVSISLLMPYTGLSWRRLHDIGIAGWLNIPWLLIWIVLFSYQTQTLAFSNNYNEEAYSVISVFALIVSVPYVVVYLIPSRGTANKYGASPD